ncbi:MAG: 50S ribosomal protein L3 [Gammaproteobacteria bacterium]|nr:50S ribosomal protein L3 [Gammaproteobacteria bacterium]
MTVGIIGRKCGMTRVFTPDGVAIPVTVIQVEPNVVVQVKTQEVDDYTAIQVKVGNKAPNKISQGLRGHYAKANVEPGRALHEFRLSEDKLTEYPVGTAIEVTVFNEGQKVNVTGTTKGKGFAGVVKRHHFRTQDNSHGNSLSHRAPGSIGQNQSPGKVFKGKKMCGHMGNVQRTIRNLEVVRVNTDKSLILLKGAVPGFPGGDVIISPC